MEYLDTGAPSPSKPPQRKARPWAPIVAGVVVFLVALVGIGIVAGDLATRTVEDRALLTSIEASENAMRETQDAFQSAIEEFSSKQSPTAEDQAAVNEALKAAAAKGHDAVTAAGTQIAAVKVLPWHGSITEAQKAYLAHNKAWQDYLAAASTDPTVLGQGADQVNSTFAAAEQPLRAAVPRPDLLKLMERVDVIYAPEPSSGGGGQQA